MLQVEEEVVEGNLVRVIFSVSIVRNMVTMLVIVQKTKEIIEKMIQDLQNMKMKKKKKCY